jgi:hypothetical protein
MFYQARDPGAAPISDEEPMLVLTHHLGDLALAFAA